MIAISACLMGYNYKYNGSNNYCSDLKELLSKYKCKPICPEVWGGLSIPRPPAEIQGGDGFDVLTGEAKVINNLGEDVTSDYLNGAQRCFNSLLENDIDLVILKARSPACGIKEIYNGDFNGKLKKGSGVAAALFSQNGFNLYSEEDYKVLKKIL